MGRDDKPFLCARIRVAVLRELVRKGPPMKSAKRLG